MPLFPCHSPSSHLQTLYTQSPRFTQQLRSGKSSANWLWRKLEFYICIVNWMCKYKGVLLKPKFQHSGTISAAEYPPSACVVALQYISTTLTLILLTWRMWRAPNNASKWQMEFNWAFKGLIVLRSHSRKKKFDEAQKYRFTTRQPTDRYTGHTYT
jgi:hypothetical protein